MPWHLGSSSRCPSSKPYAVIKDSDGHVEGCHPTREAANRQMAAKYAQERTDVMIDFLEIPDVVERRLTQAKINLGVVSATIDNRRFEHRGFRPELRRDTRGNPVLEGYGTVYDFAYDVGGGPPNGFTEVFEPGAAARSVQNRDDVRLLENHQGSPLARTRSRTLELESDDKGLFVRATLDPQNPRVQSLMSAMERGDMDEMSIGFRTLDQEWNQEYTERRIREVKLYDVSMVTFPANPATVGQLRPDAPEADDGGGRFMRLEELKAWRAQLKTSTINDLPDSAFAYIEPGGEKDDQGKTTPRSLRHFPIHDAAHVRNALARAPQSPYGAKALPKIKAAARRFNIDVSD